MSDIHLQAVDLSSLLKVATLDRREIHFDVRTVTSHNKSQYVEMQHPYRRFSFFISTSYVETRTNNILTSQSSGLIILFIFHPREDGGGGISPFIPPSRGLLTHPSIKIQLWFCSTNLLETSLRNLLGDVLVFRSYIIIFIPFITFTN